jgi:ribosomal protein S18 acetylase RimI-like enzyme
MTKINIRKFNADDLENVLNLLGEHVFVKSKRKAGFRRRLLLSYTLSLPFSLLDEDTFMGSIAETDDKLIIGTVFVRRFPFGKGWVLGPIGLHPNSRGSGIATRLMNFTMEQLRRRKAKWTILSVETGNIQARKFFEKSNFKYFGSVFMDHDKARKYVQMFTLVYGYLQNTIFKIGKYPVEKKRAHSNQKLRTNRIRTWHIMLKEL